MATSPAAWSVTKTRVAEAKRMSDGWALAHNVPPLMSKALPVLLHPLGMLQEKRNRCSRASAREVVEVGMLVVKGRGEVVEGGGGEVSG